ncbi:MAG: peptide chain release factor-like protein, partial [Planctomycetota bacterium]
PGPDERLAAPTVSAPHPACIDVDQFYAQCVRTPMRRSGPGGQHRNKVSTAMVLQHQPTGAVGEANKTRSQSDNERQAIQRLRCTIALGWRTDPSTLRIVDGNFDAASLEHASQRQAVRRQGLKMNQANNLYPVALALLLDDLWIAGGQPSLLKPLWKSSTSAIVRLLSRYAPSIQWVNRVRQHHGRLPLKV